MTALHMCNGPFCSEASYLPTKEGWLTVVRWTERSLDFHTWECLRAYAEREVLNARG